MNFSKNSTFLRLFLLVFVLASCRWGEPANPEKDGGAYLKRKGYSQPIIDAVVHKKELNTEVIQELAKSGSTDVRFLLARHTSVKPPDLDLFVKDKMAFVRSGASLNPHLTPEQIGDLFNDPSPMVYCNLAMNPSIPKEILLRLHHERKVEASWFIKNPNCPKEILEEVEISKHGPG